MKMVQRVTGGALWVDHEDRENRSIRLEGIHSIKRLRFETIVERAMDA